MLSYLFLWSAISVVKLRRIVFPNLEVGRMFGLVTHGNETKRWGGLKLLKAYNEAKVPPSDSIQIQHPQTPTSFPSVDWYQSSLAMC